MTNLLTIVPAPDCPNCERPVPLCICPDAEGNLTLQQLIWRAEQRLEVYETAAKSTWEHLAMLRRVQATRDARAIDALVSDYFRAPF